MVPQPIVLIAHLQGHAWPFGWLVTQRLILQPQGDIRLHHPPHRHALSGRPASFFFTTVVLSASAAWLVPLPATSPASDESTRQTFCRTEALVGGSPCTTTSCWTSAIREATFGHAATTGRRWRLRRANTGAQRGLDQPASQRQKAGQCDAVEEMTRVISCSFHDRNP